MQKGNTGMLLGGPVLQHLMEKIIIRVDAATKVPLAQWKIYFFFSGGKNSTNFKQTKEEF